MQLAPLASCCATAGTLFMSCDDTLGLRAASERRYRKAVQLVREQTCDSVFSPERLAVAANNLLNDVPEKKREGDVMAQSGLRERLYGSGSNHRACNVLRQQPFLTRVVARLQSAPDEVVAEMEAMRRVLTREGAIMIQIVGNLTRLAAQGLHPLSPLLHAFPPSSEMASDKRASVRQPGQVRLTQQLHAPAVASPPGVCSVLAMGAIESCFLYAAARGLPSFQHEHTAPMLVATELLTCIEGPMWNLIRGAGLAYSFTMVGALPCRAACSLRFSSLYA